MALGAPGPAVKAFLPASACAAQVAAGEEEGLYQHLLGMTHTSLWLLYPSRSRADKSSALNHPVLHQTCQPGHTSAPLPTPPYLTASISVLIPHPAPRRPRLPEPRRVHKPPRKNLLHFFFFKVRLNPFFLSLEESVLWIFFFFLLCLVDAPV